MHEKHYRSICKGISYRFFGTLTTIFISYLLTGSTGTALTIGLADVVSKVIIYYLHERAWNRISFGRIKRESPEYTI